MTTAMQILSVERRRLTIVLMYGIITAEKEFLRGRIFDFLIASISHRNGLDHIFDHLRLRTTWKQCPQEHPKALFSDSKALKSPRNQGKNRYIFLWDVDAAGSNPVTPTKFGFGKQFPKPFSLVSATQNLRADDRFRQPFACYFLPFPFSFPFSFVSISFSSAIDLSFKSSTV